MLLVSAMALDVAAEVTAKRLWSDQSAIDRHVLFLPQEEFEGLDFSDLDTVDLTSLGLDEKRAQAMKQQIAAYRDGALQSAKCNAVYDESPTASAAGDLGAYLNQWGLAIYGTVVKVGPGWSLSLGPSTLVYVEVDEVLFDRDGLVAVGDVLTYQVVVGDVVFPGIGSLCTKFVGAKQSVEEALGMSLLLVGTMQAELADGHVGRANVVELSEGRSRRALFGGNLLFGEASMEAIRSSIADAVVGDSK